MAEILDARLCERAFGELGVQLVLTEDGENRAEVGFMLLQGRTEDENVIQKSDYILTVRS